MSDNHTPVLLAVTAILAATLVELTGPEGQRIWVAPSQVVNIREPRSTQHFAPNTKCLLYSSDGKIIMISQLCDDVRKRLQ